MIQGLGSSHSVLNVDGMHFTSRSLLNAALCPSPRAMEVGYWLSVAHHKTRPVTAFTHSRRELLTELLAAPMLSTLWQQEAMPSADGAAGRMPTAAELGAVEAAFASTLPKIRVRLPLAHGRGKRSCHVVHSNDALQTCCRHPPCCGWSSMMLAHTLQQRVTAD